MFPPGYNSKEATARLARQFANPNMPGHQMIGDWTEDEDVEAVRNRIYERFPMAQEDLQMIAGTPDYVIPRVKKVMDVLRPGIFSFWIDGPVPPGERKRCLKLLGEEVIPALREHGRKLGLHSPFQLAPGSTPLNSSGIPEKVAWPEAWDEAKN